MRKTISYKSGYKYQLHNRFMVQTPLAIGRMADTDFLYISLNGLLIIKPGYAWDGASGAIDTDTIMRGALVHDALYQLMRMGVIGSKEKSKVDNLMLDICKCDGMSSLRIWYIKKALKYFGKSSTEKRNKRKIKILPAKRSMKCQ